MADTNDEAAANAVYRQAMEVAKAEYRALQPLVQRAAGLKRLINVTAYVLGEELEPEFGYLMPPSRQPARTAPPSLKQHHGSTQGGRGI